MTLSNRERITLINQFRILECLYPDDAEEYARQRAIVERGYTVLYGSLFGELWEEVPEARCQFVLDVLSMYRALTFSNSGLSEDERVPADRLHFPGFDGNDEADLLGFAKFFTAALDRFTELTDNQKRPIPNSHMGTVSIYNRMLSAWRTSKDKFQLAKEDIDRILSARIAP